LAELFEGVWKILDDFQAEKIGFSEIVGCFGSSLRQKISTLACGSALRDFK
jgi:hypothetical protein